MNAEPQSAHRFGQVALLGRPNVGKSTLLNALIGADLSNADGTPVTSAADAMAKLVAQLTRPVRWDLCSQTVGAAGVAAIVEFPPAGALVGIAKRELKGTPTHAIKAPTDLDGLAEF